MITISLRMDKERLGGSGAGPGSGRGGSGMRQAGALAECAAGGEHRIRPEGEYSCRQ